MKSGGQPEATPNFGGHSSHAPS